LFGGLEKQRREMLRVHIFGICKGDVRERIVRLLNPIVNIEGQKAPLIVLEEIELSENKVGDACVVGGVVLIKLNVVDEEEEALR
jgi:hypothetical protein